MAQSVLVPPPSGVSEPIPETPGQPELQPGAGLPSTPAAASERIPFQWGQFIFRPHLTYTFRYGSGILSQTNQEQKTVVQSIAPGILVELGEHWTFNYTPTIVLYSDPSFDDTLNHAAGLAGRTIYNDWRLGLDMNGSVTSDPIAETGQQTDQQLFLANVSAGRALTEGLSFDLTGRVRMRLADDFNSSTDYSTMNWLNREWGPHLAAGIGLGFGYEDVDLGADMTHQRAEGRIIWHLATKLHLTLGGGAELRQFVGSDQSSKVNPLFNTTLRYQLFEHTSLSLNGSRSVSSSYFANQFVERTSVSLSLTQRLLGRLNLGVSAGYGLMSYGATSTAAESGREDENTFFSVNLGTSFAERGRVSVFYSHSRNSSTTSGFDYSSDQVGFQVGYRY
jgi:hypothetical protein